MKDWTTRQKKEVQIAVKEMLRKDFPDTDMFTVPMIANIVIGRKP
jgi:hypothetical protein